MAEHRVIERVLETLQAALQRAASNEQLQPAFFLDAAEFIQGYADDYHHRKEEGVLFEEMEAQGFPKEGGPIVVMLSEHEQARAYTRAMKSAAERWHEGDETAQTEVTRNAQGYVSLLRDHIYKEDNILYPMADQLLSPEDQERMAETFREMERTATSNGSLGRLLALVDTLEKAMQVST
jgi:hemerythrin-like domain-containing protein